MSAGSDADDLERLARAHGPRVLGYLRRRTTPDVAADTWQEVMTIAWRRIGDVPSDDDSQIAWLVGVARKVLANQRRGEIRRSAATERLREALEIEAQRTPAPVESPVTAALDRLSPADRELLTLIYWDDLTTDQAAVALGIRGAACRKRLQRARLHLQDALEHEEAPACHTSLQTSHQTPTRVSS